MARPNKQGVDYFPLDVHVDDKFKFIEIKYKLEGFAIVVKLLQKIYSCGYWYKWTEDEALLFSDEIRADYGSVTKVVQECLDRDVFDKSLHEKYSILTSKGIQKRYKEIVRRRKDVEVTEEYLLIDGISGVNDDINTSESKRSDIKSTQSKEKGKRKESKKKVNKTKAKAKRTDLIQFRDLVLLTQKEYDRLIEEYEVERVELMLDKLDAYKGSSGREYEDDNKAIRNWVVGEILKQKPLNQNVVKNEEAKRYEEYENENTSLDIDLLGGFDDGLFSAK